MYGLLYGTFYIILEKGGLGRVSLGLRRAIHWTWHLECTGPRL